MYMWIEGWTHVLSTCGIRPTHIWKKHTEGYGSSGPCTHYSKSFAHILDTKRKHSPTLRNSIPALINQMPALGNQVFLFLYLSLSHTQSPSLYLSISLPHTLTIVLPFIQNPKPNPKYLNPNALSQFLIPNPNP